MPAYGSWNFTEVPEILIPKHLCPLFLLILSLYTCLPLPTVLSIICGVSVATIHVFVLASYRGPTSTDAVNVEDFQDDFSTMDHFKKVIILL